MNDTADFGPRHISRRGLLRGGFAIGGALAIGDLQLRLAASASAVTSPTIYDTVAWGAQPPKDTITVLSQRPTMIIVHHTASSNTTDYSQAQAFSLARNIQQWHFDRGWIDTGQQFTISRGGYAMEGRHESLGALNGGTTHVRGAHTSGQNDVAVGIENEGTYTSVGPPDALYNKLVDLCAYMCQQYAISTNYILGHRDFNATQCPGDVLYAELPQLRSDVNAKLGVTTTGRIWPTVFIGQIGERVKSVQYLLRQAGHSLTVDGDFGPVTESAVESFQSANGLVVDGVVGKNTWEKLAITVRKGSSGEAVKACQSQLKSKGYAVTVDGVFGTGTESAVKKFQKDKGLLVDGIVGLDTWSKLVT